MLYQILQQRRAEAHLPEDLQAVFARLCDIESSLCDAKSICIDPEKHAAFTFVRVRPIALNESQLLFGCIVPTRHIQEISVCQARWDVDTESWLPDESAVFFKSWIASSQFSELITNTDKQSAPMTFKELGHQHVPVSHQSLDASFVLKFAALHSAELHRFEQACTKISSLQEQCLAGASLAKIKESFSNLNLSRVVQSDGTFSRTIMHEVMSRIDAKVKSEVIHDLSRHAHSAGQMALSNNATQPSENKLAVNLADFYRMHIDVELLDAQVTILNHLGGIESISELHPKIHELRAQLVSRLERFCSERGQVSSPAKALVETYKLQPALSAGCISISKPTGRFSFFADRSDSSAYAELSFSFSTAEVNQYGEISVRSPIVENLKLAMTSGQFLDLLQSAQIGSWTPSTLIRAGTEAVPFPQTAAAERDGKFSNDPDQVLERFRQIVHQHSDGVRSLLMTKTMNAAKRESISSELDKLSEQLHEMRRYLESSIEVNQSEVIEEHQEKLKPQLLQLVRSGGDLSHHAPARIQQVMKQLHLK